MAKFDIKDYRKKGTPVSAKFNPVLVVNAAEGEGGVFILRGHTEGIGKYNQNVWTVEAVEGNLKTASYMGAPPEDIKKGENYDIYGSGHLDKCLTALTVGDRFAMSYLGTRPMKDRKGPDGQPVQAHLYEVIKLS